METLKDKPNFSEVKTRDDVAKIARKIPGAIGFVLSPGHISSMEIANAIISYDKKSSDSSNKYCFYMFVDQIEKENAKKPDGTVVDDHS